MDDIETPVNGIIRMWRYVPPAHYTLRVDSFSLLLNNSIKHYETGVFESCGNRWKLLLYPNGNTQRNVKDHMSLYLGIENTENLGSDWEVNVTFKFFLYNHMHDKYLTFQDAKKATTRFFPMKTEVGFDEWFPLATLKDPSNGFLLGDCCILGAEVFVINFNGRRECMSMIKNPMDKIFTWKITDFNRIDKEWIYSDEFAVGDHKWKLLLYPKGSVTAKGDSISLFLVLADEIPSDQNVHAEVLFWFKENPISKGKQSENKANHWFSSSSKSFGYPKFLSLNDFNNKSSLYLVNGTLTVQAQITLVSKHKNF